MKFETKQEAFNYWNTRSITECETRATELKTIVETDPNADVVSLNIEYEGLREAINNIEEKADIQDDVTEVTERSFNILSGANFRNNRLPDEPKNSKEYRSAFFKNLMGKELTPVETRVFNKVQEETRASAFGTSSNTGAVIPEQTLNEIIQRAKALGGLMSVARSFNLPTNVALPVGTSLNKAQWHAEGEEVESKRADVTNIIFNGYELLELLSISNKLERMSISAFESYLVDELTNSIMTAIAEAMINGTGENQGKGLLTGIEWTDENTVKANGEITYKDITETISRLNRGYESNAYFIMNNKMLWNSIYGLTDGNDRPIFVLDPTEETKGKLFGFPVVVDDFMPDDVILFGDPKYMAYNLPQGITLDTSRDHSFSSGLIDFRAIAIADCRPILDEAFIKLEKDEASKLNTDLKGVVTVGKK